MDLNWEKKGLKNQLDNLTGDWIFENIRGEWADNYEDFQ